MKDHEIAALVNKLRDIALEFHDHQSLRDRIARVVVPALKELASLRQFENDVEGEVFAFLAYGEDSPIGTENVLQAVKLMHAEVLRLRERGKNGQEQDHGKV